MLPIHKVATVESKGEITSDKMSTSIRRMFAKGVITESLESHPRLVGALFTLLLLLNQTTPVMAGAASSRIGP